MVESGINVEMEDMAKLGIIMEGNKLYDYYKNSTHTQDNDQDHSSIKFDLIIILLICLCSCLAICSLIFMLELIVAKYSNREFHIKRTKNYNPDHSS